MGQRFGVTGGDIGAYYGSDPAINIQDFNNIRLDRGPNTGDARHRFLADWIYELPSLKNLNPIARTALGGWEVAGIFNTRTGEPLTLTQPCGPWHCRPDHAAGSVNPIVANWENVGTPRCVVGARCSVLYLDRAAFTAVPLNPNTRIAVRAGNVANGYLRTPLTWNVDFSLSKNFKLRERMNLQVRADMFNSLNHVNYNGPNTDISSATFGEINGAGAMRVVQLERALYLVAPLMLVSGSTSVETPAARMALRRTSATAAELRRFMPRCTPSAMRSGVQPWLFFVVERFHRAGDWPDMALMAGNGRTGPARHHAWRSSFTLSSTAFTSLPSSSATFHRFQALFLGAGVFAR